MFITRQQAYFENANFVPANSIRWKQLGERIYSHDNFDPNLFYGNPDDAKTIAQSPQILDAVFRQPDSTS